MSLREDLLVPIEVSNPAGADLRYSAVYDTIREARREDDDLAQGAWQRERKVADFSLVMRLATDALKTKTKDLQIAAWLTEALLHREGFSGLTEGLAVCRGFVDKFWETVYPLLEDGDAELRAAPLDWIGSKLEPALKARPLTRDGYNWFQYKDSRLVGFEDQAKESAQKKTREKLLAAGKLAPEVFDKSFAETPKSFYSESERNLDSALTELAALAAICNEKFADSGPTFGKLKSGLEEERHTVHALLQKKRETEPDPVQEAPIEPPAPLVGTTASVDDEHEPPHDAPARESPLARFQMPVSSEAPDRAALVAGIAAAAAALRRKEPFNPASYLLLRGLRWGDLRAAAAAGDATMLEAPPTEVRQQIKRLAIQEKWNDLLEAAETVMALPCSRAWLDLQRFVVESCVSLGSNYDQIAIAIRSEVRALVHDVPQLLTATLMDETPAANAETKAWIKDLAGEPGPNGAVSSSEEIIDDAPSARWRKKFVDSQVLAKEALRSGQESRAFEIMQTEITRQKSARGRFQRKLQFVELCLAAGKEAIAQPILDDLIAAIDYHKLEEWEDRSTIAQSLATIAKASKKISGDAKEKQKYFERICRLDPVQALNL